MHALQYGDITLQWLADRDPTSEHIDLGEYGWQETVLNGLVRRDIVDKGWLEEDKNRNKKSR